MIYHILEYFFEYVISRCRAVSGFVKVGGGQVVMLVVMRHGAAAGALCFLFCQKVGGGAIAPLATPSFCAV